MVKCPGCGGEVFIPRKSWYMSGRPDRMGKRTRLEIGIFDCPQCDNSFRAVLSKKKI